MAEKTEAKQSGLWENVKVIIQALLLAVVIRTVFFQPFTIPSGSMMPTLLVGDYIFVNKFAYGYSKYSLPFSPDLFSGRIFASEPDRGDIVVFRFPPNPDIDYISASSACRATASRSGTAFSTSTTSRSNGCRTARSARTTSTTRAAMFRSIARRWTTA